MKKVKKLARGASMSSGRAMNVARPAAEALLLAAVALGCAQLGWSALQANPAQGSSDPRDDANTTTLTESEEIATPFSMGDAGPSSQAAAATMQSMSLAGIRMADEESASGAILTLDGGAQRAFRVGQEISPGLRLTDVRADYVMLSYEGVERQLELADAPRPQRFNMARALMGEKQDAAPPSNIEITRHEDKAGEDKGA